LQKIGHIEGINVFPDFNNLAYDSIVGDYAFSSGTMALRESRLSGSDANASTTGTIELPTNRLNLLAVVNVRNVPFIPDLKITGTPDNPVVRPQLPKQAVDAGKKLLQQGANQLLKGILGR
ncbi:MAG TPA: AsmA-like C-terminal region-containing protein, partial [Elusimicrobiota bacterium]|nr:AsmA-like C-terminal region-containing protein [Elusimicrobiota bacterium]